MSYGISMSGVNGSLGINSDWASLVFVGKAEWLGAATSLFSVDHGSYQYTRNFGPYLPSTSEGAIAGTGVIQLNAIAETPYCGAIVGTLSTPDDNGLFQYTVAALTTPVVFVNTSRYDVTGTVVGMRKATSPNLDGTYQWAIIMSISYPSGMRNSAPAYLSVYCFSKPQETVDDFGVRVYRADGTLAFNSEYHPLGITHQIEIASTTITGNNLATLDVSETVTSFRSGVLISGLIKPAFMNVDWARYSLQKTQSMGLLTRLVAYGGGLTACEPLVYPAAVYNQTFVMGGIRLDLGGALLYSLTGLKAENVSIGSSASDSTVITKREILPTIIPVIDGADYE